eukprot:10348547-Lingulodinium_polyedra.AAC.1
MAATQMGKVRSALAKCRNGKSAGRCVTSTLLLDLGNRDPAIALPMMTFKVWQHLLECGPEYRKRA